MVVRNKSKKRGGFRFPRFSRKSKSKNSDVSAETNNSQSNSLQEHAKNWIGIQDTIYWKLKPAQWAQIKSISHKFSKNEFVLIERFLVNNERKKEHHILVYKNSNAFYIICQSGSVSQESQSTVTKVNEIFQTLVSQYGDSISIVICGHSHGAVSALLSGCYIYNNTSFANLYIVGSGPYKWLSKENHEFLERNPTFRDKIQIYGLNIEFKKETNQDRVCSFYEEACSGNDVIMSEGGDEIDGSNTYSQYDAVTKIFKILRNCNISDENQPIDIEIKSEAPLSKVEEPKNQHALVRQMCVSLSHDWKLYRTFFKQFFNFD